MDMGNGFDGPGNTPALDNQCARFGGPAILQLDLADAARLHPGHADLQIRVVTFFTRLDDLLASVDQALEDCRIRNGGKYLIPGSGDLIFAGELHRDDVSI